MGGGCQWIAPGCGTPAITATGCFYVTPCTGDSECEPALHCRSVDPCGGPDPCIGCTSTGPHSECLP
jgi:hypothetical protein